MIGSADLIRNTFISGIEFEDAESNMNSHNRSHLNTAIALLGLYKGLQPLGAFLKEYFAGHKKYGSKDRKQISRLCYSYFRLGHTFMQLTIEERIVTGLFMSTFNPDTFLSDVRPEWDKHINETPDRKASILNLYAELDKLFPFKDELSDDIEPEQFALSFFEQPNLYLRIRPGRKEKTLAALSKASIPYILISDSCAQLQNTTDVSSLLDINKDVVIQDLNSQKVLDQLPESLMEITKISMWDCCAASGGKSILFNDIYPHAHITVSDVRKSIIINLRKRFQQAGIHHYNSFVTDISNIKIPINEKCDVVIADVPCSGSGTWSRTPEQLYFFKKEKIMEYAATQKKIAINALKALKPGGYFLYITCSVFKEENENLVAYLTEDHNLKLVSTQYYKGYQIKADTLFSAVFRASV